MADSEDKLEAEGAEELSARKGAIAPDAEGPLDELALCRVDGVLKDVEEDLDCPLGPEEDVVEADVETLAEEAVSEEDPIAEPDLQEDDPMGVAYDLERGAPIDHSQGQGHVAPWQSRIESAKEFFSTELLYRFDILETEEQRELRGRYCIELRGQKGGIWTLDIDEDLNVSNRKERAEIVFNMDQEDFLQIVNGVLNPQLAMLAKKLSIKGDMKKAVRFERLLAPVD